jgi:hypothetical protein
VPFGASLIFLSFFLELALFPVALIIFSGYTPVTALPLPLTPYSRHANMDRDKPREVGTVQFIAPYRQCEAALNATAMASFLARKLKDVRSYKFKYLTTDTLSNYCSPFVDAQVYRVVSPRELKYHAEQSRITYWFGNSWGDFHPIAGGDAVNCLIGDFTKWDRVMMRDSKRFSTVVMPCKSLADRSLTLVSCPDPPVPVYPGGYISTAPMRHDLLDRERMAVLLSMCGINRPENRLAILRHVEEIAKNRRDVLITLLMDGHSFRDERQYLDVFGKQYSDRVVIVNSFSDYEFANMTAQNDIFIDLNPVNGVGYMLSAALNSGLVVCGYRQSLYNDILCDGEYGILMGGTPKELGFGFECVTQNWDCTFKFLNEKIFHVNNILRWIDQRNRKPGLSGLLEDRVRSFFRMFTYLSRASVKFGEFAEA